MSTKHTSRRERKPRKFIMSADVVYVRLLGRALILVVATSRIVTTEKVELEINFNLSCKW